MEKKTIEEIKKTVLAYCEEVCPNKDFPAKIDCGHLAFGYVEDDGVNMEAWFLHIGTATAPMSLYALAGEQVWLAAYRILGLEARDAVDALEKRLDTALSDLRKECDFSGKLTDENTALETRNAALVEALDSARAAIEYDDDISTALILIKNALTANTEKGGAND